MYAVDGDNKIKEVINYVQEKIYEIGLRLYDQALIASSYEVVISE